MSKHEDYTIGQVGLNAEHAITKMRDPEGESAVGNVLRRTCQLGGEACKQACQLQMAQPEELTAAFEANPRGCSDENMKKALEDLGLVDKKVLVIGVTANEVGFGDQLDEYQSKDNPNGWQELPGFNAFFARTDEVDVLGRRLGDCADLNFEFEDAEGNKVIGFEHGTRINMFGKDHYPFEIDGRKVSFTEYALTSAVEHYGADPTSVSIKLASAIKGHNFTKTFTDRKKMEEVLPGWYKDGYVKNLDNPAWKEGDPVEESDTWEADTRAMIVDNIRDTMDRLGIPPENFSTEGIIDPGDSQGEHSSHQFRSQYGDTRDLYLTYVS